VETRGPDDDGMVADPRSRGASQSKLVRSLRAGKSAGVMKRSRHHLQITTPARWSGNVVANVKAAIPAPLKQWLRVFLISKFRYWRKTDLRRLERSARVRADWKFFTSVVASEKAQHRPQKKPLARRAIDITSGGAADLALQPAAALALETPGDGARLNIVFISYDAYDNNSAIHITGFANSLVALGHRVVVCAAGATDKAGDFGVPRFRCIPHDLLRKDAAILADYFAKGGNGAPDLVHCWTPRHVVRRLADPVIERYRCPYVVHLEDNEAAIARAQMGNGGSVGPDAGVQPRPDRSSSAERDFVAGAAGATIIVDALRLLLPATLPYHLLEPGVDGNFFASDFGNADRQRLCDALGVPVDSWITVYPGNTHAPHADDMFSFYTAIHALNARGYPVHLIRTGKDYVPVIDPRFGKFPGDHVTDLGFVPRHWLVEILKLADFFIQPGGPDNFNNYRLPSKIPEWLATGRPVVMPRTNIGLLMQDRVNAILMKQGDAAEITACVEALINDPALADRVGKEGRRFALAHFDGAKSAKGLASFYRQVLGR